ncbi:MAG: hypothetical protein IID18_04840 [Nitrospinae bacterium]|nr:hypothetical protein [Nitrospinota bacterium]
MIFHQFTAQPQRLTIWNKISLGLWIVACLALLSLFTFGLFVIALLAGVVIFTLNLFRRRPGTRFPHENKMNTTRIYRPSRPRDDDIIDV